MHISLKAEGISLSEGFPASKAYCDKAGFDQEQFEVKQTQKTNKQTKRQTERQTTRQTNRQTDKKTNRQTDKRTDKKTDRQTESWTFLCLEGKKLKKSNIFVFLANCQRKNGTAS